MAVDDASVARAPPPGRAILRAGILRDGRVLLLALLACYFLVLLLLSVEDGLVPAWRRLGVFALDPSFADMRSITSAWECTRAGIDVLPTNPCDPWERPANYPSIWTAPAVTGLGQESTAYFGIATGTVFFASVLLLIGRVSGRAALLYLLVLCSPAIMLGVERGNADLLLFAIVVLAVVLLARTRALAHALLLLAAILKLFPLFAWILLLRQPRRWVLAGGGALLLAFAAYSLVILDQIRAIRAAVPQEVQASYGAAVGVEAFQQLVSQRELTPLYPLTHPAAETAGHVGVVAAGLLVGLWLGRRWQARDGPVCERDLAAFWAGAGIFCGTFALFQNYDYRLAFLLLCLPQLLRWSQERHPQVPRAGWALAAIVALVWLVTRLPIFPLGLGDLWVEAGNWFPFEEIINWLLFAYLAAALTVTAPRRGRVIATPGR